MNKFKEMFLNTSFPRLIKKPITRVQLAQYAGASGDFNPIHIDEVFAKKSPVEGVIAHGMLSMGFIGQYVEQLAGEYGEVYKLSVQFRGIVRPGDEVECEAKLDELTDKKALFTIRAKNQKGETVVIGETTIVEKDERL